MVCIYCGGNTRVTNSRSSKKNPGIWRRRHCDNCNAIFTTSESPDLSVSISVIKREGSLETFSIDDLYVSIFKSLSHRREALNDARHLTNTITTNKQQSQPQSNFKIAKKQTKNRQQRR